MLRFLRTKTKVILWVVIAAFVGTIFMFWGMKFGGNDNAGVIIAEVDGEPIYTEEYYNSVEELRKRLGGNLSEKEDEEREKLMKKYALENLILSKYKMKRTRQLNITAPPDEIIGSIKQSFRNEDGSFNAEAYNNTIERYPASYLKNIENNIRQEILLGKFDSLLSDGVLASEAELKMYFLDTYRTARFQQILIDPGKYLRPDEMTAYYRDNQETFTVPGEIKSRHILIKIDEDADTALAAQAEAQINGILKQIREGASFEEMAKKNSQDGSASKGGDLGWLKRTQLVKEFADAAFALKVGEIGGPVRTQFGYHLILVEDKKPDKVNPFDEVKDEIKALILAGKPELIERAETEANQIYDMLKADPSSFDRLAQQRSDAPSRSRNGDLGFIPRAGFDENYPEDVLKGLRRELIDERTVHADLDPIFNLKKGDFSKVLKSPIGMHIVRCLDVKPYDEGQYLAEKDKALASYLKYKGSAMKYLWEKNLKNKVKIKINDPELEKLYFKDDAADKADGAGEDTGAKTAAPVSKS